MIIGNFSYDKKSRSYVGDVTTLSFHRSAMLFRPLEKSNDKEPDYRLVAQGAFGFVEFGAAWKRKSERGQDFLSVSFDDPLLPRSINAALFPNEKENTFSLVWNRSKSKTKEATSEKTA